MLIKIKNNVIITEINLRKQKKQNKQNKNKLSSLEQLYFLTIYF